MSGQNLPDENHFLRVVTWNRVQKDENDNPIGILPDGFRRRENEVGLSVNWLEQMPGNLPTQLKLHLAAMRTGLTISNKARLALANVGTVKEICASRSNAVRIVHAPKPGNAPHSEIRRISRDDDELLDLLSREAVISHHCCGDI